MNPGDKVKVTYGPYVGSIGELMDYYKKTQWSTPYCRVKIPFGKAFFEIVIDPWDITPYEEEETNEADATSASNL